jgi:hypothetical protein
MDKRYLDVLDNFSTPGPVSDEQKLLRAMFYGDFGTGKSTLALQLAHMFGGEIIWVTTDSAWRVIDKYPDIKPMVRRIPYQSFSQVAAMALAADEKMPGYENVNSIIWDSVSRGVDRTLRLLADGKKVEKNQLVPRTVRKDGEIYVEEWPHYRTAERALGETVQILNNSSLNVIYTAHTRFPSEKDREQQKFAIRPNLPEASYKVVAEEVSLVGWLHRDAVGSKRMCQTMGTKTVTAKSQIATVDETILETSKIPDLIQQWKDAA